MKTKPFFSDDDDTRKKFAQGHQVAENAKKEGEVILNENEIDSIIMVITSKNLRVLCASASLREVLFQYLTDREKRSKINEIIEANEGIALASEVLMTISRDEEERARLMQIEKIELDYQSGLVTAERKGHAKGLEKGREEGRTEAQQEIIELLKSGKSPEEIIAQYSKQ
jgi:flagellar biosynthesis/type III secretory pathway protein FliH